MHEVPHRVVVDLQATPGKLDNEPPYGEIDPLRQPNRVVARNRLRLMTAHLARSNAAGILDPLHPTDCRADRDAKLLGCSIAGHPALDRAANLRLCRDLAQSAFKHLGLTEPARDPSQFGLFGDTAEEG